MATPLSGYAPYLLTPIEAEIILMIRSHLGTGFDPRGSSSPFGGTAAGTPEGGGSAETNALVHSLITKVDHMSETFEAELSKLKDDISAQSTVIASATVAFRGFTAALAAAEATAKAAGATDAQIAGVTAVRVSLEGNTAALAAAIPANTPAAVTSSDTSSDTSTATSTSTSAGAAAGTTTIAGGTAGDPNAPSGKQVDI